MSRRRQNRFPDSSLVVHEMLMLSPVGVLLLVVHRAVADKVRHFVLVLLRVVRVVAAVVGAGIF